MVGIHHQYCKLAGLIRRIQMEETPAGNSVARLFRNQIIGTSKISGVTCIYQTLLYINLTLFKPTDSDLCVSHDHWKEKQSYMQQPLAPLGCTNTLLDADL